VRLGADKELKVPLEGTVQFLHSTPMRGTPRRLAFAWNFVGRGVLIGENIPPKKEKSVPSIQTPMRKHVMRHQNKWLQAPMKSRRGSTIPRNRFRPPLCAFGKKLGREASAEPARDPDSQPRYIRTETATGAHPPTLPAALKRVTLRGIVSTNAAALAVSQRCCAVVTVIYVAS